MFMHSLDFLRNIWNTIETSKRRAIAWGDFLVTTFRKLGITDNEVIQNCYVGRSTYYRMKQGELINVDAYIRLTDYAVLKIRERMARWLLPHGFMEEWRKKIMGVLGFWDTFLSAFVSENEKSVRYRTPLFITFPLIINIL